MLPLWNAAVLFYVYKKKLRDIRPLNMKRGKIPNGEEIKYFNGHVECCARYVLMFYILLLYSSFLHNLYVEIRYIRKH